MIEVIKKQFSLNEEDGFNYGILWILAIVLYAQNAWVPGFFQDGYLYASFGKNAALHNKWLVPFQSFSQYSRFEQHPPFIFILEGVFFKIFGHGFTQARLFGVSWVFMTLGLFQYFFNKWNLKKIGFVAGFLLLIIPSLMKKARFPNLDLPLMFAFVGVSFCYLEALRNEKEKNKYWMLMGTFWGFALLAKGLAGILPPVIVFAHLIYSGKFSQNIKTLGPWIGFIIGLVMFSFWPIALKFSGNIDIFYKYFDGQFLGLVVKGRGNQSIDWFLYFKHLLKTCLPLVVLAFVGFREKRKESLFKLALVWFVVIFAFYTPMKFKYSHYLIPLYPALAILAAYGMVNRSLKAQQRFVGFVRVVTVTVGLTLLVFPLTNQPKRHKELFQIKNVLNLIDRNPKSWYVVNESFEYWSMSSFSSFVFGANPFRITTKPLKRILVNGTEKDIIFLPNSIYPEWADLLNKYDFSKLIYLKDYDAIVLMKNIKLPLSYSKKN